MIRSFLAIDFPEKIQEIIDGYGTALRQIPSKIKWVAPHQSHLTLKFFGDLTQETIERISQTLSVIVPEYPGFNLTVRGIGAFPNLFRPRVIWLGLGGDLERLKGFQQTVEQALVPMGIPKEGRPFHPHLTIGRNKANELNELLYRRLSDWPKTETAPFGVEALILYQSDLKPSGPVYTPLKRFPLKQG